MKVCSARVCKEFLLKICMNGVLVLKKTYVFEMLRRPLCPLTLFLNKVGKLCSEIGKFVRFIWLSVHTVGELKDLTNHSFTGMQRRIGTLVRYMLLLEHPQFLPKYYETLPK